MIALALGIGANCSIFAVVNGLLLRSFPFADPARLVEVTPAAHGMQSVDGPERFNALIANVAGENLFAYRVTPRLFEVLGVRPLIGAGFSGADPQVMLSYDYWRKTSGDPAMVGTTLTIDRRVHTVTGVMPAGFGLISRDGNLFIRDGEFQGGRSVARMKPGVTVETARTELSRLVSGRAQVIPIAQAFRRDNAGSLLLLQGAAFLVLLITCANAGTLRLAAGLTRRREFAIRSAIGAGRGRLILEQIVESAILGVAGCVLGFGVAQLTLTPLESLLPASISRFLLGVEALSLDGTVFLFGSLLALAAILIAGLPAALGSLRIDLMSVLRDSARGSAPGRQRTARWIAGTQVALAVVLTSAAMLSFSSVARLESAGVGFSSDHVLRAIVAVQPAALDPLLARITAMPGVLEAGFVAPQVFPFGGPLVRGAPFRIAGRPDTDARAELYTADAGYFRAIRLPLIRGRLFERVEPSPVVILSESVANRHWPDGSALGAVVTFADGPPMTVIGIAGDVRNPLATTVQPTAYRPPAPGEPGGVTVMIRTAGDPMRLVPSLDEAVRAVDAVAARPRTASLETEVGAYLNPQRFTTSLFGGFALAGLALAALGVYGVMQCWAGMRMLEFGVRVALGATRGDVIRVVLRSAGSIGLAGLAAGIAGAIAAHRTIASQIHGLDRIDPWILMLSAAAIAIATLAAALAPAWRASRADPLLALKRE